MGSGHSIGFHDIILLSYTMIRGRRPMYALVLAWHNKPSGVRLHEETQVLTNTTSMCDDVHNFRVGTGVKLTLLFVCHTARPYHYSVQPLSFSP